jgi:superfamily II DNA or RNA helicase
MNSTGVYSPAPGDLVALASDRSTRGAVVGVLAGEPENRVQVFMDGNVRTLYASQLVRAAQESDTFQTATADEFRARLTALHLLQPGMASLYSLHAARVDFIPYQFRPVLRFIRADRPRLLIADGVGVGKTVEAGLILRELQARRDVNSVLVICPRPLVTERKWERELRRFDERFTQLDGPQLQYCLNETDRDGVWPAQHAKTIVPYSLLDDALLNGKGRKKGLLDLDPPPRFDLVIVDEAHHIRNPETQAHRAVRFFCDHAEAVLFLTATPIQLGSADLFVLLNALRPDLILDRPGFDHLAEPNPFINQAAAALRAKGLSWCRQAAEALNQAADTPWGKVILRGNPVFQNTLAALNGDVTEELRIRLITDVENLHTFAGIINRTRRRDIGAFTLRRTQTVEIPFTPVQRQLHDAVLRLQEKVFRTLHGDRTVAFMMTTIRRQTASCIFGLAPFLRDILARHLSELDLDELDEENAASAENPAAHVETEIQAILAQAETLYGTPDPKLDALRKIIREKQTLSNNKLMVFSTFRHTLRYLHGRLQADGIRVAVIHGGTPDDERIALRTRFEQPRDTDDALDVLLFSEIGCEGLDYQFCDGMVNYDLPWNPMRIEQRIGRIDRNGQASEHVDIFNLITPGTVDADIYHRCLFRIGVFEHELGASEEILGEITQGIQDIAQNMSLTDEERREKFQQLADNNIRTIQEQARLEERQAEFFGIRLPQEVFKKEIDDATNVWLDPESLRRLVSRYLRQKTSAAEDCILGEKALKTLRLSQDARNVLLSDFRRLPRQNATVRREWESWLKGNDAHLPVTFDADCAAREPKTAFLTPLHPLVRQAATALGTDVHMTVNLAVRSDDLPAGDYPFAVYAWHYAGQREDMVLTPVSDDTSLDSRLPHLLESAVDAPGPADLDTLTKDRLDHSHHALWQTAAAAHRQREQESIAYRKESLVGSHRARITQLQEQLAQSDNSKIRRMRQAQLDTAENDFKQRIANLDAASARADILATPVVFGRIHIRQKGSPQ